MTRSFWPTEGGDMSKININYAMVVHGGQEFEYLGPVKVGDTLTGRTRVADAYEKEGKRGGVMSFYVFETTFANQDGVDVLLFNGANVNENIDISANGERVRFFRDVANVTMDLNDVEGIVFRALGGADNIVINDVSGGAVGVPPAVLRQAIPRSSRRASSGCWSSALIPVSMASMRGCGPAVLTLSLL